MPAMVEVVVIVLAQAIGAWLVTYLVHGTLLFVVASLLERARPEPPAWRVMLWRTALVGPLVTATLQTTLPHFSRPLAVRLEPANALLGPRPGVAIAVIVCWSVALIAGIAGVMRARRRARVSLGHRAPTVDPRHDSLVGRWARLARLRTPPHVTISSRLASPAAVGRAEICLPAAIFDGLSADQQEALVAHEIAHIAHRDPAWCAAASAIARVFVFQPLNRIALRRLRTATEEAADAFAVRWTGDPLALAHALAALAPHIVRARHRPATAATGSPIVERITRIVDGRAEASVDLPRARALAWAAALLLVCHGLGPGARFNVSAAARSIPWLAPSREAPGERMLEVRAVNRQIREIVRRSAIVRVR